MTCVADARVLSWVRPGTWVQDGDGKIGQILFCVPKTAQQEWTVLYGKKYEQHHIDTLLPIATPGEKDE